MSIDIYHTRRTNFKKCYYYVRDTNANDLSKFVLMNKPAGHFYAKLYSPDTRQNQDVANTFRFSENQLTLVTEDDINELKENDIILYDGKAYVALNIQKQEHLREAQYGHGHYTTYISLRR